MPKARTKQAAASAADSASSAPTAGTISLQAPLRDLRALREWPGTISHSETKPLSGGSAEIADAADQNDEGGRAACGG